LYYTDCTGNNTIGPACYVYASTEVVLFIWTYWASRLRRLHNRGPFELNVYIPVHELRGRQTTDGPVLFGHVTLGNITRGVYGSTAGNVTTLMSEEGYTATNAKRKRSSTGDNEYDEAGQYPVYYSLGMGQQLPRV
jgi:hypothetical protein